MLIQTKRRLRNERRRKLRKAVLSPTRPALPSFSGLQLDTRVLGPAISGVRQTTFLLRCSLVTLVCVHVSIGDAGIDHVYTFSVQHVANMVTSVPSKACYPRLRRRVSSGVCMLHVEDGVRYPHHTANGKMA